MALYIVGQEFNKVEANYLLTLGYAKVDALGDKEVRMDDDGTYYFLYTNDGGGAEKIGLEPDEIITRLGDVTTGIPRSALSKLWRDSDTNDTEDPYIQTGAKTCLSNTSIPYDNTFDSVPRVLTGLRAGNFAGMCSFTAPTTTAVSCSCLNHLNANVSKVVEWCAMGPLAD